MQLPVSVLDFAALKSWDVVHMLAQAVQGSRQMCGVESYDSEGALAAIISSSFMADAGAATGQWTSRLSAAHAFESAAAAL